MVVGQFEFSNELTPVEILAWRAHYPNMAVKSDKAKRPRDPNELAKLIVDIATGEKEDRPPTPEEEGKDPAAVNLGRRGGRKGGKARAVKLSPDKRSAIASKAAKARWGK